MLAVAFGVGGSFWVPQGCIHCTFLSLVLTPEKENLYIYIYTHTSHSWNPFLEDRTRKEKKYLVPSGHWYTRSLKMKLKRRGKYESSFLKGGCSFALGFFFNYKHFITRDEASVFMDVCSTQLNVCTCFSLQTSIRTLYVVHPALFPY